ncbi:MAG: class I adenylate-forming enzyme family protein, partial [Thermodesulfobacteriota bacterium]
TVQQPKTSSTSTGRGFVGRFAALRRAQGDALAILDADASRAVTRDDLARAADGLAGRFSAALPHASARAIVAVQLPNGPPLIAAVLACWQAELVPMPVDHDVAPAALAELSRATGATLVVRPGTERDDVEVEALPGGEHVMPPDAALLKVTSGSTGEPRAVAVPGAALEAGVEQIVTTMRLRPTDRNLVAIPLAHSYAFDNVVLPLLRDGMPAVLSRDLTPRRLLAVARDSAATVLPTVPFLLDVLARSAHAAPLPELRLVISAGAPLPVAARERFTVAFGVRPRTFYGSTECGGIAFDREGAADLAEGCVGAPLDGVRITIEQPDEDGIGRVRVHSRSTAQGYHPAGSGGDVELGAGTFLTADLGSFDERGRLNLVGRVRDVVNVGGRKVYPAEVERVIRSVPGVRDAAVTGVARSAVAGALRAVVAAEPHVTRGDVVAACERRLARYKVPRTIEMVDELPRTARGKLDRRALDVRDPIG